MASDTGSGVRWDREAMYAGVYIVAMYIRSSCVRGSCVRGVDRVGARGGRGCQAGTVFILAIVNSGGACILLHPHCAHLHPLTPTSQTRTPTLG